MGKNPVLGILQRGLWGLGSRCPLLFLQPPCTAHTPQQHLGGALWMFSVTHWVQQLSQQAGCTFHHFSLGLKPLDVSESFQSLQGPAWAAAVTDCPWDGMGVRQQNLCYSCAGDLVLPSGKGGRWIPHHPSLSMVMYIQKSLFPISSAAMRLVMVEISNLEEKEKS